jgi:hypothetical protein
MLGMVLLLDFDINSMKTLSLRKKPAENSLILRESVRFFAKKGMLISLPKGGGADKAEHCLPVVVP